MLVRVAKEVGPSIEWWLGQPFAFLLWTYRHLQELDRLYRWIGRVERIDGASLSALSFHEPKRLEDERRAAIADAAPRLENDEEVVAHALAMAEQIARGRVLQDEPVMDLTLLN